MWTIVLKFLSTILLISRLQGSLSGPLQTTLISKNKTSSCILPTNDRIRALFGIFDEHQAAHNLEVLTNEAKHRPELFCQRKYTFASDWNCRDFGNSVYTALNAHVHAVILNRTYVVSRIQCDGLIEYADWLPRLRDVMDLMSVAKCNKSLYNSFSTQTTDVCNLKGTDKMVLQFSPQQHSPFRLYGKSAVLLSNQTTYELASFEGRLRTVLSNPVLFKSNFESFGVSINRQMKFSPKILALFDSSFQAPFHPDRECDETTVTIGMHLRHFKAASRTNPALDREFDSHMIAALDRALTTRFKGRKCNLLLASDRLASVTRLEQAAASYNCTVYKTPHPMTDSIATAPKCDIRCQEQGPWAQGVYQLGDLHLLSHSQYFMGTARSTYSHFIVNLISFEKLLRSPTADTDAYFDLFTRHGGGEHAMSFFGHVFCGELV